VREVDRAVRVGLGCLLKASCCAAVGRGRAILTETVKKAKGIRIHTNTSILKRRKRSLYEDQQKMAEQSA
jgi:hypothetical protein